MLSFSEDYKETFTMRVTQGKEILRKVTGSAKVLRYDCVRVSVCVYVCVCFTMCLCMFMCLYVSVCDYGSWVSVYISVYVCIYV